MSNSDSEPVPETSLVSFKGLHAGKRLFILASGPSLAEHDLSRLDRRLVMGLNRSCIAYTKTHYHCVMDARLFKEYGEAFSMARYLFTIPTCPFGIKLKMLGAEGFSWDLTEGIYSGYTIAYFALQVAVYMGFQEIFFVGLDLSSQSGRTHFFGFDFHSGNHDQTEFPKMARTLRHAAVLLAGKGISVYNCSPRCQVKEIPFMDFERAVSL